jgi:hypothetical protein
MNSLLCAVIVGSAVAVGVEPLDQETTKYDDHGITFRYPKTWKATADQKGVTTITVQKDRGTQAMLQIYPAAATPTQILDQMDKTFRKLFEGKLVKGSDQPLKRKLAGEDRDGITMAFEVAKGVTVSVEVFAFVPASKKQTIGVVFQYNSVDADVARMGFKTIAESLQEAKAK